MAHACFGGYKQSHYRTIYFHNSGCLRLTLRTQNISERWQRE